jgi:hypothetical protein
MKKETTIFVFGILLVLSMSLAYAELEVNAFSESEIYIPGNLVQSYIFVKNNFSEAKNLTLYETLFTPYSPPEYPFMTETEEINIEAGDFTFVNFPEFNVSKTMIPGIYFLNVIILDLNGSKIYDDDFYLFEIANTSLVFEDINFQACIDADCESSLSVFFNNSQIYVVADNREGYLNNVTFTGNLTLPDNSTTILNFINNAALISSSLTEQLGKYQARIVASKEGYEDYINTLEFKVVSQYPSEKDSLNYVYFEKDAENAASCLGNCLPGYQRAYDEDWGSVAADNGGCSGGERRCIPNNRGTNITEEYSWDLNLGLSEDLRLVSKYEIRSYGLIEIFCWGYNNWISIYADTNPGIITVNIDIPYSCKSIGQPIKIRTFIIGANAMAPTFYYESKISYYTLNLSSIPPCRILMGLFNSSYQSSCGNSKYDLRTDFTNDGIVDALDISLLSGNYGNYEWCNEQLEKTYNPCSGGFAGAVIGYEGRLKIVGLIIAGILVIVALFLLLKKKSKRIR